ncbi:hypothetical protein CERSUDRAFT_125926 [Gelatoporia subvermispora B]|uniref:C2H2-type domain-containing protein n=1 Tax=Ceriporiopsis subvermispora (strain B) TaxID=914234 RepID=M2R3Z8_CERS8|nr:hypothetical protein CERSUDRAFT_125926 [Gelatoporia subvermispora B]
MSLSDQFTDILYGDFPDERYTNAYTSEQLSTNSYIFDGMTMPVGPEQLGEDMTSSWDYSRYDTDTSDFSTLFQEQMRNAGVEDWHEASGDVEPVHPPDQPSCSAETSEVGMPDSYPPLDPPYVPLQHPSQSDYQSQCNGISCSAQERKRSPERDEGSSVASRSASPRSGLLPRKRLRTESPDFNATAADDIEDVQDNHVTVPSETTRPIDLIGNSFDQRHSADRTPSPCESDKENAPPLHHSPEIVPSPAQGYKTPRGVVSIETEDRDSLFNMSDTGSVVDDDDVEKDPDWVPSTRMLSQELASPRYAAPSLPRASPQPADTVAFDSSGREDSAIAESRASSPDIPLAVALAQQRASSSRRPHTRANPRPDHSPCPRQKSRGRKTRVACDIPGCKKTFSRHADMVRHKDSPACLKAQEMLKGARKPMCNGCKRCYARIDAWTRHLSNRTASKSCTKLSSFTMVFVDHALVQPDDTE